MDVVSIEILKDVAPDPVYRMFTLLPVILIAVVVILSVILLRKYFSKR